MTGCAEVVQKVFEQPEIIKDGVALVPLEEAAESCRLSGFGPQLCAPCLYIYYSDTTADVMANTIVKVWVGEVSNDVLKEALIKCKTEKNQRAYTDQEICRAVRGNLSLQWLDSDRIEQNNNIKVMGLYHGDLTTLKPAESFDFLVVSAFPKDYSPTPGSLIGALNNKGVSVAALAQNKAADYGPELSCWISQPITQAEAGIAFNRILVYEQEAPALHSASHMQNIFTALARFIDKNKIKTTVGIPMVSTGSGAAEASVILTAIFNIAKQVMESDFLLYGLKIVVFQDSQVAEMTTLFEQLKNK